MSIAYHSGAQKGILTTYNDADSVGDVSSRRSTSGVVCVCILPSNITALTNYKLFLSALLKFVFASPTE